MYVQSTPAVLVPSTPSVPHGHLTSTPVVVPDSYVDPEGYVGGVVVDAARNVVDSFHGFFGGVHREGDQFNDPTVVHDDL